MVVIQGGSTPETLPAAIEQIAALRVRLAELEQLGSDVKGMGTLLALILGQTGLLDTIQGMKPKGKSGRLSAGQKMKLVKQFTGVVMDALDEDSELRKLVDNPESVEPFKRVLAYAGAR